MPEIPLTVAFAFAVFALVMAIASIPLAVIEVRVTRHNKAAKRDRGAIERLEATPILLSLPPSRRFMAKSVAVTKFGDKRRKGGHLAELIAVETGPISLPGE